MGSSIYTYILRVSSIFIIITRFLLDKFLNLLNLVRGWETRLAIVPCNMGDAGFIRRSGAQLQAWMLDHKQGSAVSASIFFGAPVFSFLYFFILHFSENTSPPFPMDLLPWLVGWRAVWALLSTSYYVPDETWQSVEVNTFFMLWYVVIFAF